MSGVALRCSNCGTAQPSPGECDACHEAQVLYFCTNHQPGVWLDGEHCPRCGASFGDVAVVAPPIDTAVPPRRISPAPTPPTRRAPIDLSGPHDPDPVTYREDEPVAERRVMERRLLELLTMASGAGRIRTVRPDPDSRPRGGGCMKMVLWLLVLAFAIFIIGPLLLGGAILQLV
ncbi:hypothetical protein [uncultured Sphingomonas sp.]|uniref:hypothetical protein n=1 Tax=uncultured Sphingomonas sp. TaxID=158754 RepID=UPI0035CA5AFB